MKYFLLLNLILLHFAAFSQKLLTIDEAIAIGLKNNYDILLVQNNIEFSQNNLDYAQYQFYPTLFGNGSMAWNNQSLNQTFADGRVIERKGAQSTTYQASLNLSWVLYNGKIAYIQRHESQALNELDKIQLQAQANQTLTNITITYFAIIREKQRLKAFEDQISIIQERIKIAQNKREAGLGAKPELLQAQVDSNEQQAGINNQKILIQQAKLNLQQLMGLQDTLSFEVGEEILIDKTLNLNDLQSKLNANPNILMVEKNKALAQIALQRAKAGLSPTVTFNSGYSFFRQENQAGFTLSNQNYGFNANVTVSVPIFNRMQARQNISSSQINVKNTEIQIEQQKLNLSVALKTSFQQYQNALQQIDLESQNIAIAQENLAISVEQFRQGLSNVLALREAQNSLQQTKFRLTDALYNAKEAETQLKFLAGDR
jgi:outer membrane protein